MKTPRTHIVNGDGVSLGSLPGTLCGHKQRLNLELGGRRPRENADRDRQQREPDFEQLHGCWVHCEEYT